MLIGRMWDWFPLLCCSYSGIRRRDTTAMTDNAGNPKNCVAGYQKMLESGKKDWGCTFKGDVNAATHCGTKGTLTLMGPTTRDQLSECHGVHFREFPWNINFNR